MNNSIVFILLLLLVFLLIQEEKKKRYISRYIIEKKGRGNEAVIEAAKALVGKRCIVYMISGELDGIIKEVSGHSMTVESVSTREHVNLDFVLRIRELPEKKRKNK